MSGMPSVMSHDFGRVPSIGDMPRSSFDRTAGFKTTMNAGYLVPCYAQEVLPGDTASVQLSLFGRMATPLKPIMDNIFCEFFFFFVPNRLVWDNWQKFMGEQINPDDSTDYLVPIIDKTKAPLSTTGYTNESLFDYFSLPTLVPGIEHTTLQLRAYNLIWNEWFRDQNMQDSVTVPRGDGPDDPATYTLLRRGKRHDYFTSCLPWPQKGDAVTIPLTGNAPVIGDGKALGLTDGTVNTGLFYGSGTVTDNATALYGAARGTTATGTGGGNNKAIGLTSDSTKSGVIADLSDVTAATINELRQAFQIQKLLERNARGGTRYTEILRAHFGVISPDARLQRPEYLGGGSTKINTNPIAQTAPKPATGTTTPQGNLAAYSTVAGGGIGFHHSFVEHGWIIGMMEIRADLNYQQGLDRQYSRRTRYDFYWPELSHLGEQAVLNKEIYTQGTSADDDVFGYQERWAEYRYQPSKITGKFRSNDPQPLDIWHLAQDFASLPVLNEEFIQDDPPIERVIAVPSEPHFLMDLYIKGKWARPMPVYSVPGLIDHF